MFNRYEEAPPEFASAKTLVLWAFSTTKCVLNQSLAIIVFISNPKCVRLFHYQMMCLPTDEYNILLAYESEPDFVPANFLWETLIEDAKIGNTIEEAFTGESGGIFCAVCNTHSFGGTRIEDEDLSAHLRSQNHRYAMFGKSSKGLFDVEYSFAYKWGTYHKLLPEKLTHLLKNHPERKVLKGTILLMTMICSSTIPGMLRRG
ncbi:unnamed protein product [Eruca vesicaria subsp. sativa]|uniref:Uncharacterized protein n=1 Tax=Eruca vesicaria subsp. sativa TaxID=29727 RepID=A0ABC8LK60_ERUVS|nr:unnamed protein product [Eruca vesicaria subsp. sativa]